MDPPPVLRRKRLQSSLLARTWWFGLIVAAAAGIGFWLRPAATPRMRPLAGYISDVEILQSEYRRFHGKTLADRNIEDQFRSAAETMLRREYLDAAAALERIAKQASVPVVFNDLGVLYAALNDHSRALNSFREALSRDGSYRPVRDNLDRLRSFLADSADPVSRELEPNNSVQTANLIALDKPAEGEIVDRSGDLDSYRFASPPAPRDVLAIEVSNRSATLMPRLRIYDSNGRVTDEERSERAAGSSITHYLSLEPNTVIHLQVWGGRSTGGAYVLTVRPLKAYDTYEPNDDVFNAHRMTIADPIGKDVRLNGRMYEVIGVFEQDPGMFGGFGVDQFAVIPLANFRKNYPEVRESFLIFTVREDADMDAVRNQVIEAMRRRRHVPHKAENDFEVADSNFLSGLWDQLTGAMALLTGVIGSIGLLVGGIGVMNIMLISVTERTGEIGIRKAIGARKSDIRIQFLLEAVTLSGIGGVIGIMVGGLISLAVRSLASIPATVSPFWVLLGVLISVGVGLFFGYYPATRAANLDPIVCLRYE